MSDELAELRKRKLEELQRQSSFEQSKQQEIQDQIGQIETLVKQFLTKDAITRYTNLKIAHTEKAMSVLTSLGQMIQAGQIREKITDDQLKKILIRLEPKKPEFNIQRK